jgi:hypothetical protein
VSEGEAPVGPGLTTGSAWEALAPALTTFSRPFPAEAIALAEANWEEVAPRLLDALEAVAATPEQARDGSYMLHLYAMFLLAEHRERHAFAPLLRIAELPEDVLEDLLGDVVSDGLGRCLASTLGSDADLEALRVIALNDRLYLYARGAALNALLTRVMEGDLEPDAHREWLAYCGEAEAGRLRSGNADDPTFLSMVVADLADVGAAPALDTIRRWYADGLVDPSYVSLQEVEADARLDFAQLRLQARNEHYARSVTQEMGVWHCFKPESEENPGGMEDDLPYQEPYRREDPKVGRNEPCPCGSGKKYKKCCGAG